MLFDSIGALIFVSLLTIISIVPANTEALTLGALTVKLMPALASGSVALAAA